jgi:Spy/CpxP family protein refolding chaperone
MNKAVLVVFAFIGIFLSGAIAGGFVAFRFGPRTVQKKAAEQLNVMQMRRLADHLELTPEQREKIRPIMQRSGQDLQAIRRQTQTVMERAEQDILKELTPEQRTKYTEFRSRQRSDEREQRLRRGPGGPGPGALEPMGPREGPPPPRP